MKAKKDAKLPSPYINRQDYFLVSSLSPRSTGVTMNIIVCMEDPLLPPCVKVQADYEVKVNMRKLFCVSISGTPEIIAGRAPRLKESDIKKLFEWVKQNVKPLLDHWNGETSTGEFCCAMKVLSTGTE